MATPRASAEESSTTVAYHFDRNALADSTRTGRGQLVALTETGNLLVFNPATFSLVAERAPRVPVTCLGPAEAEDVVVGLDDGRIVRVGVPSLEMTPVGTVEGRPTWIGRGSAGALLVVHGAIVEKPFGWADRGVEKATLEELGTGRALELPFVPSTRLADAHGRLWLGADNGEWGGRVAVVDLSAWTVRAIPGDWQGVYGFTESSDGRVFAYGGTNHMGGLGAFVYAIEREPIAKLFDLPFVAKPREDRPTQPISNVVPLGDGKLVVFAYDEVFETDTAFRAWRRWPKFETHYAWGRPDAVGASPAIRAVHVLDGPRRGLAISTSLDGWIELREGKSIPHRLAGQLGMSDVSLDDWKGRIVAWGGRSSAMVLEPGGWRSIAVTPPIQMPETTRDKLVPKSSFALRSDGRLFAVFRDELAGSQWSEPRRARVVTAECSLERCEVRGQETSLIEPATTFVTPDGAEWALDERGLWRFREDGRSEATTKSSPLPPSSWLVGLVPTGQPPWLVRVRNGVLALTPGARGSATKVIKLLGPPRPGEMDELDVAACGARVLVASPAGVCELDVHGHGCAPLPLAGATGMRRVGCDRDGHFWLGGRGLWRLDGDVAAPRHDLDGLVGEREIWAIGRDTGAGLPIAIEGRGVAVISPSSLRNDVARPRSDEGALAPPRLRREAVLLTNGPAEAIELIDDLHATLSRAKAGRYAGALPRRGPETLVFYGPDATRMVEIMRAVLVRRGVHARLVRRAGPPGSPEQIINVAPPPAHGR